MLLARATEKVFQSLCITLPFVSFFLISEESGFPGLNKHPEKQVNKILSVVGVLELIGYLE